MKPDVSIIIPTYQRSEFVLEAVLSAVKQSYSAIEVIIVDDGSDQKTLTEIEAIINHPDVQGRARLIKQDHAGVCIARNRGVQEALGKYIQFLDSDDLLHPKKVEVCKEVLDSDPELDMCYSLDEYFKNIPGDFGILWNSPLPEFHLDRFLWDDPVWHTGSAFWRRSTLEALGGWKADLGIGYDDWEFHIRAICKEINYVFVPLILQFMRDHDLPRSFNLGATPRLEESKRYAAELVWNHLNENSLNSVNRSDALAGLMLFSADTLMERGFKKEAHRAFDQASKYSRSVEMRFLASFMSAISFSGLVYRFLIYPFRRLLRKRLFHHRGNWKVTKVNEVDQPADSNVQEFLKKRQKFYSTHPLISVIISTHNGEPRLKTTLPSHFKQTAPPNSYEIILVDNASTDRTHEYISSLSANNPQLRYVYEKNLGLHNARHAGARAAKGEIVLFTDDDASVDPNWIQSYLHAFQSHPLMNAAGGPVEPLWEETPEEWLSNLISDGKFFPALGLMKPFNTFRLTPDCFFFGVNLAIEKKLLFELGGFNPESFGDTWLGDGESGLLRKLWQNGKHVGFIHDARVHHNIPKHRMSIAYLKHWSRNWGASDSYTKYSQHMPGKISCSLI